MHSSPFFTLLNLFFCTGIYELFHNKGKKCVKWLRHNYKSRRVNCITAASGERLALHTYFTRTDLNDACANEAAKIWLIKLHRAGKRTIHFQDPPSWREKFPLAYKVVSLKYIFTLLWFRSFQLIFSDFLNCLHFSNVTLLMILKVSAMADFEWMVYAKRKSFMR